MSGVNLIDFTMPSAVPVPAGKSEGVKRVGGFKLSLPKKEVKPPEKASAEPKRGKVEWWKLILPIVGVIMVIKLATWTARRYGK